MWSDFLHRCEKTLFVALGGGGDIVSTSVLALQAERAGFNVGLASIVWERFVYDPVPGPIGVDELENVDVVNGIAVIGGDSFAIRDGRRIDFQASKVSRILGRKIIALDLKGGHKSLFLGIKTASRHFGFDCVVGIDVGGDILASGEENGLWSPLADSLGLSALALIEKENVVRRAFLAVHSPSADAELSLERIFERTSLISRKGGFLGTGGVTVNDLELLEKLLGEAKTEASMIQFLALKGEYGERNIRENRKIVVSPIHTATFFYDPLITYEVSPIAKAVIGTNSVFEAREKLNELGIVTELDLEYLALEYKLKNGRLPGYAELAEEREKYRRKLLGKRKKTFQGE